MTYSQALEIKKQYESSLIGQPMKTREGMIADSQNTITNLLIAPVEKIRNVFGYWWYNGKDNNKAIEQLNMPCNDFEVYVIAHEMIGSENWYLPLEKYLRFNNRT